MTVQMYNHLVGLPLSPLGKQVKQEIRNFPYELGDCLIVKQISYLAEWGVSLQSLQIRGLYRD